MRNLLTSKTIVALAVAIAATAANVVNAYEQPIPPPAAVVELPPNIVPESDLAQVFKLVQANVELCVIKNFIANSRESFALDAGKIIALSDAGVPSNVLDMMLEHDRQIIARIPTALPAAAPVVVTSAPTTPPPAVTVNYFYDTLSPYGNWVEVGGYGRCWRPTTVVYDDDWRPYCNRGHWVYSDCGWYWDSDYAWGSTFHYGRWFRDTRFGWCWWPDTTWAPSWVLWRSGEEHCGWAPLPPRCYYRQEHGFLYNGNNITVGFDFGLNESCFSFVAYNHFFDRRVREHCEDSRRVTQFYHNTTIVNNYNFDHSHNTVVNNGISAERFTAVTHHPVQTIAVNELPNAARHGWRGEDRNERSPGNFNRSPSNHTGSDSRSATVGAAVTGGKVYSQESGSGRTVDLQNHNPLSNADNQRGQHSSRLEQQTRGQNQITTPALVATPPQRTALTVQQPQVIHPQTPAQTGQVLERNTHSSRLEQQQNHSAAVINTRPPQRSEVQVQQPQIIRPAVSSTVLPPAANFMQQRNSQQLENHVFESRNNNGHPANNFQPPVQQVQQAPPQHTERAPAPANNSDSRKSDRDKDKK